MLVIPAIDIHHCHCVRTVANDFGTLSPLGYSDDPVEVAKLWRRENAKSLFITDYDGLYDGVIDDTDVEMISRVIRSVEIPVYLLTRTSGKEECRMWLDMGVYRLVIHDMLIVDPDGVRLLIEEYGTSRLCAGMVAGNGRVSSTWRSVSDMDTVEFADLAQTLGFRRVFLTDKNYQSGLQGPNYAEIERVARAIDVPLTAAGGVSLPEHIWKLQEMEPLGIDSVVIGRAFYENRFPCQELWRDIESEQSKLANGSEEQISTSTLKSTSHSSS